MTFSFHGKGVPVRHDRRLVSDCKDFMGLESYYDLFLAILMRTKDKSEHDLAHQEAQNLLEKFREIGSVPDYMESEMIDIMTEKIPIYDGRGRQIHRKFR